MSAMKLTLTTTDGNKQEINITFGDLARYDVLRNRLNFPPREGNEFIFMGLVTFCSLLRTGQLSKETKPDDFIETIDNLEPVEDATEGAEFPDSEQTTADN